VWRAASSSKHARCPAGGKNTGKELGQGGEGLELSCLPRRYVLDATLHAIGMERRAGAKLDDERAFRQSGLRVSVGGFTITVPLNFFGSVGR
jgi:hypothetical protein